MTRREARDSLSTSHGRSRGAHTPAGPGHFKDAILDQLAEVSNVAQFVSFGPGDQPDVRRIRIRGNPKRESVKSAEETIPVLLAESGEGSVNVRSFDPYQPRGHEFVYGIVDADRAIAHVRRLARMGLYTIVNETVNVSDGGVSGVAYAGILEFAPEDTPRCVEKPGTVTFPRVLGAQALEIIYGLRPDLEYPDEMRVEFSLHPLRRGIHQQHTIIWETEHAENIRLPASITWPNRFSRFIGDKVFGLVVAEVLGLRVPGTTVISRRIAPFTFGQSTGSSEVWIRTAPTVPMPGRFTTRLGWIDPFELLSTEDPEGDAIPSVMAQEGVEPSYSGAMLAGPNGSVLIEGVRGRGDDFMQGNRPPESLPEQIKSDVMSTFMAAARILGPVRLEWVHDGTHLWVVQLHRGAAATAGQVIYPGRATKEHRFHAKDGLEALRALTSRVKGSGEGIILVGRVGVTSHLGDVLRRARIPSRIEAP
jgi:hypothetical protein